MLGSGENFGYRTMHQKLRMKGVVTNRETVRLIIKTLDPLGVGLKKSHKLKRCMYTSRGPNFLWHVDGYDKLKSFGFPIHGCIDGYSRKILWLNVSPTSNDSQVIATYFIHCIEKLNLIPRLVRSDRGSENTILGGILKYLRREHGDAVAGDESFRYGPSVSNQRIESWWAFFKKSRSSWRMNYFRDLIDEGIYDPTVNYQKMCLYFTFSGLLQQELDMWNNHCIRNSREAEYPGGNPDVLYYTPSQSGDIECKLPLHHTDLELVKQNIEYPDFPGYTPELQEIAGTVMAGELYLKLIEEIQST